jgi:hypothetical protein
MKYQTTAITPGELKELSSNYLRQLIKDQAAGDDFLAQVAQELYDRSKCTFFDGTKHIEV